jgi:hypothetical protein
MFAIYYTTRTMKSFACTINSGFNDVLKWLTNLQEVIPLFKGNCTRFPKLLQLFAATIDLFLISSTRLGNSAATWLKSTLLSRSRSWSIPTSDGLEKSLHGAWTLFVPAGAGAKKDHQKWMEKEEIRSLYRGCPSHLRYLHQDTIAEIVWIAWVSKPIILV